MISLIRGLKLTINTYRNIENNRVASHILVPVSRRSYECRRGKTGIKILVVDDDPSIGELMKNFLEIRGYQPIICSYPQEVLDITSKTSFSLAFVDMNLPGMNGLELAARLKSQDPENEPYPVNSFKMKRKKGYK